MRLEGKTALITGGSAGIGLAIAECFVREGAGVAVVGRDAARLRAAGHSLRDPYAPVLSLQCDVTSKPAVVKMVRRVENHFGHIDILVNNAGYFPALSPIEETPDEEWHKTLQANLTSAFYVSRAVFPGMIEHRGGSIIMISSSAAKHAYTYGVPYAAAKAGMLGLTRSLAAEGGLHSIRVNALCPGMVTDTEMTDKVDRELLRISGLSAEDRAEAVQKTALLHRLMEPADVARAALFLATEDSASMTGQALNVDAGMRFD